jgi:hypothetical protein
MGHYSDQYGAADDARLERLRADKAPIVAEFVQAVRRLRQLHKTRAHAVALTQAETALLWLSVASEE